MAAKTNLGLHLVADLHTYRAEKVAHTPVSRPTLPYESVRSGLAVKVV
jgi:hypothetical protein